MVYKLTENAHESGGSSTFEETLIKPASELTHVGKKVLIASFYTPDPVTLAITRLGAEKVILVYDKEPNKELSEYLEAFRDHYKNVLELKEVKTDSYDIVETARRCVEVIDSLPKDDEIYVNITSGRKTRAIALLFAAYCRHDLVRKIAYNPEEDKKAIVWLPRLSFHLTESQKTILEALDSGKYGSIRDLVDKLEGKVSSAMVYRAIDELRDIDLVDVEDGKGVVLTDAGKIARL